MKSLLLALATASSLFAADSGEDGFVPMFNGRDLSGWVNANCAPETWSVTNGMIHCTGRPTGAIRTERQYENFIMEAEWRHLSKGGNSGIFLWGTPIAAPGVPFLRGIEVQVLDNDYTVNGKNQWYTTHGDVFPIHGATMKPFGRHNGQRSFPSEERSKGSPEWNHYRIVCTNGVVRLSVNGKEVSGGEDCNYRKGYLALESEGGPVQFRNVRIKELPPGSPPENLIAPRDEGYRTIFTGLDLRGWKTTGGWAVEGERLRAKAEGKLLTEKEYADAAFIFDVRVPKDFSGTPPAALIRDTAIPLDGLKPDAHTRFELNVKGNSAILKVGDKISTIQLKQSRGPFGFENKGGSVELMNLYAREL